MVNPETLLKRLQPVQLRVIVTCLRKISFSGFNQELNLIPLYTPSNTRDVSGA